MAYMLLNRNVAISLKNYIQGRHRIMFANKTIRECKDEKK